MQNERAPVVIIAGPGGEVVVHEEAGYVRFAAPESEVDGAGEGTPAGVWVSMCHEQVPSRTPVLLVTTTEPSPGSVLAESILERWRRLEVLLEPMTRHALECLAHGSKDALRRLKGVPEASGAEPLTTEPLCGVRQLPLRSPTLPPAAHTNCYIAGHERLIVVDPAPYDRDERDKLAEQLESMVRRGRTIEAIVLTHHHGDHYGAASWLSERIGAPIAAHPITARLLSSSVEVSRALNEGDTIELGDDASGQPFTYEVLFTPGHAAGHIVLVDQRPNASAMIVGDMVAAVGSIIIDPPDGDMARYIRELERLAAADPRILFAAHGPPIVGGTAKLRYYVQHRLQREAKVMKALQARREPSRPEDLLGVAYDDTPPMLYPLAARACLAHLLKLVDDGRAVADGGRFVST